MGSRVLSDLAHEAAGTFGRWYVTLFGIVFAWCALRDLGWRRTLVYSVVALLVGGLAENGSVHLGVPYTRFTFNSDLRGDELFLGDVPLMVPLSYTFMAYFAFSSGRLFASGPVAHARVTSLARGAARACACSVGAVDPGPSGPPRTPLLPR
jgi:uncharacterized membrane protein